MVELTSPVDKFAPGFLKNWRLLVFTFVPTHDLFHKIALLSTEIR